MTESANPESPAPAADNFSVGIQWLLGTACALLIASLYYGQPLTGLIIDSLGMPRESTGLIVTLPLLGYGVGLLLIVPLGDLIENRWLVLLLVSLEALCLMFVSLIARPVLFLGAAFLVGVTAAAVQY
jgi:MFS family permease